MTSKFLKSFQYIPFVIQNKELPANTGRARLNLSGAVDIINHRLVIHEDHTLNAESTIRFFRKIEEAYPEKQKIHFVTKARISG